VNNVNIFNGIEKKFGRFHIKKLLGSGHVGINSTTIEAVPVSVSIS